MASKSQTPQVDWEQHYRALLSENGVLKDQLAAERLALQLCRDINATLLVADVHAVEQIKGENARLNLDIKTLLGRLQATTIAVADAQGTLEENDELWEDNDQMAADANEALIELYRLQGGLNTMTILTSGKAQEAVDDLKAGVDNTIDKLLGDYEETPVELRPVGGVLMMPPAHDYPTVSVKDID